MSDVVYEMTWESPDYGRYGLANQMQRAAVCVASTIAEGSSRGSKKDFARFIAIAYGFVMALVAQLPIAQRQEFIDKKTARVLRLESDKIARLLRITSPQTFITLNPHPST